MYRYIKYKEFNNYSLNDLENDTISFGMFSIFSDQNELCGYVDYEYLNKKYCDNSITKDNVRNLFKKHIENKYLQFSLSELSNFNDLYNIDIRMYKDYCANYGFIIYYEFESLNDVYSCFNGEFPLLKKVSYIDKDVDLTTFVDCLLMSIQEGIIDDKKFNKLLELNKQLDLPSRYMTSKVLYDKPYENESRILININDSMKIINKHLNHHFIKPSLIFIPVSLKENDKKTLINICLKKGIKFKILNNL